jgi:hypothetical protein
MYDRKRMTGEANPLTKRHDVETDVQPLLFFFVFLFVLFFSLSYVIVFKEQR